MKLLIPSTLIFLVYAGEQMPVCPTQSPPVARAAAQSKVKLGVKGPNQPQPQHGLRYMGLPCPHEHRFTCSCTHAPAERSPALSRQRAALGPFAGAAFALESEAAWKRGGVVGAYSQMHRIEEEFDGPRPMEHAGPLSTCKTIAKGLGMSIDGATVFCPTNGVSESTACSH